MLRRMLLVAWLQLLVIANASTMPEVTSYAKVSRNGATSTIVTSDARIIDDPTAVNQGSRSFRDSTISRSPIYVPSNSPKLRYGEAIDHPSTKKYSTLDREAVAKLDNVETWKQAQERFHPPANFERTKSIANAVRQQRPTVSKNLAASGTKFPVPSYATLPEGLYSTSYDYQTNGKPMEMTDDSSISGADSEDSYSKIPDSYRQPDAYSSDQPDSPKFPVFQSTSSFKDKYPPKPADYPDESDHPSFSDDSYGPHESEHDYPHDLILDHPPDHDFHDHHHHHHHHQTTTTTTEEPEMDDQRLSKRPYSYYYIGKKLWYLPLYFSIYFIIYIAALVLKSITRHKINFPATLAAVAQQNGRENSRNSPGWLDLAKRVFDGIDMYNSLENKHN